MSLFTNVSNNLSLIDHYSDPADALKAELLLVEQFKNPSVNYHIAWWATTQSLIAPRSLQSVPNIKDATNISASCGWPVYFRSTGGDITPQGEGILNVAVAFALDSTEQPSISGVYEIFCAPMLGWLQEHGCSAQNGFVPGSFCDGEYNIVVNARKFAGTAQRWTRVRAIESRQIVFAHALLLFDAKIDAGVEAINRFFEHCNLDRSVQSLAHVNLNEVLETPSIHWQEDFVRSLNEKYSRELKALTS